MKILLMCVVLSSVHCVQASLAQAVRCIPTASRARMVVQVCALRTASTPPANHKEALQTSLQKKADGVSGENSQLSKEELRQMHAEVLQQLKGIRKEQLTPLGVGMIFCGVSIGALLGTIVVDMTSSKFF